MLRFADCRRIISFTDDPAQVCNTSCYGPIRFALKTGEQVIVTQGGIISPPGGWKMESYDVRHADQLYFSMKMVSTDGAETMWPYPTEMVTRKNIRWMNDPVFMAAHPETFVSAFTGGNVVQVQDQFIGIFCGCVSDPNCCTEWSATSNPYGSCVSPFPYFQAFIMRSPNGIDGWEVVENLFGKASGNVIEDSRFLGLTPTPEDYNLPPAGPTGFKGVDKCGIGVIHSDGLWYGTADFWSSWGPKTLIWRADLSKLENGPEIRADGRWYPTADGILPAWINTDPARPLTDQIWIGNAFDTPAGTITLAPPNSLGKYMVPLLMSPDAATGRDYTQVGVAFSDNLTTWTPKQPLTESMEVQIGDPWLGAESDGSITILFGATTCPGSAYAGREIYEGNVKL